MEIIRGKKTSFLSASALNEIIWAYDSVHLDIGTGDGRFVQNLALSNPTSLVIGVDACRENLVKVSRSGSQNSLFVIANAEALPDTLNRVADHVTINFPWGSLLQGLLEEDSSVMHNVLMTMRCNAKLAIHLNGGALQEQGYTLEAGSHQVQEALRRTGFKLQSSTELSAADLKAFPTTWAKRLAYGRDPRATHVLAKCPLKNDLLVRPFKTEKA